MTIQTIKEAKEAIKKNLEGQGNSADTTGTIVAVLKFILDSIDDPVG